MEESFFFWTLAQKFAQNLLTNYSKHFEKLCLNWYKSPLAMSSSGGQEGSSSSGSVHSALHANSMDDSVYANVENNEIGDPNNGLMEDVVLRTRPKSVEASHLSSADAERIRKRERELEKIHRRSRELIMTTTIPINTHSRESSPDSLLVSEDQIRPAIPPKASGTANTAPPPPPKSAPPPLPPRSTFAPSSGRSGRRSHAAPLSLRRRVQSPHRRDFKDFSRHPRDSPLRLVQMEDEDDSGADSLDNVYHAQDLAYYRHHHAMSPPYVTQMVPYDAHPNYWMGPNRPCQSYSRPRSASRPSSASTAVQVRPGVEERLLQLEGDKDQLHLQVALLSDQVESQSDKISSLEQMLDDKKILLQRTEDVLQREILTRSSLETKRLELLSEISGLKLKQASMEKENVDLKRQLNDVREKQHHPPPAYGQKTRLDAFGTMPRRPRSRNSNSKNSNTVRNDFNPADLANDLGKLNNSHSGSAPSLAQQHLSLLPVQPQTHQGHVDHQDKRTSEPPSNVVRRANRHRSVERSTINSNEVSNNNDLNNISAPFGNSGPIATKPKGLKKFLGKMRRANSGLTLHESNNNENNEEDFIDDEGPNRSKSSNKTVLRNSSGSRFASLVSNETPDPNLPLSNWRVETLCAWLDHLGLYMYAGEVRKHVKSGRDLLEMSSQDLESKLGMRHCLHRKKVLLALQAKQSDSNSDLAGRLDQQWVTRWLDDLGLPQYKDAFLEARVDGRVLNFITVSDLVGPLRVTNMLHHLSIRRGIQILRQYRFEPTCLKRRASPEDRDRNSTPIEVAKWSNHRVMEWLRHVDLAEYAANLRGSGVHGALLILEPRFNSDLLASLLAIPGQKTLLRRHLGLHFAELVGPEVMRRKREAQHRAPILTATAKVRNGGSNTTTTNNNGSVSNQLSLRRRMMEKWRMREKQQSNQNQQQEHDELDFDDLLCPLEDEEESEEDE